MSKIVKQLIMDDLRQRLDGVKDALLVNIAGLNTDQAYRLRKDLRSKGVKLLMVKNSVARRATEGTPLAAAFESAEGSLALCWGAEDIVALAKIVTKVAEDKAMAPFAPKGGVLDGSPLTAAQVVDVSKWPSRGEVLSMLVGQILGPGSRLAGQLNGPGGTLVSQLKEKAKESEGEAAPA
ncbi:MAG: 50S ribosomal protein L10 [Planctomycetaceae bacterium]|nr:50S ribosomal protein L10 [Planctomycetaceae bacterium]